MAVESESLELDFQALDEIEAPDSEAYRFNGRPVIEIPKDMDAEAEREGYIPVEKRGAAPWTADYFLSDKPAEFQDDVHINTPEEEEEIRRHVGGPIEDAPSLEQPSPEEISEENAEQGEPTIDNRVAEEDLSAKDKPKQDAHKRMPTPGQGSVQQVGPGGMLLSGAGRGGRALIDGVRRLGMLGAGAAAAATIYSAKGARWGWETNKRQRRAAYQKWSDKTVEKAEGLPARIDSALSKLEGTDLMKMASQRAELQAKESPTSFDRKQIDSLATMMQGEIAQDPKLREASKELTETFRATNDVLNQSERHMRRGVLDEASVEERIKPAVESTTEKAKSALSGMVDENGNEMSERIRQMADRIREFIKSVASFFTGARSKQSMG